MCHRGLMACKLQDRVCAKAAQKISARGRCDGLTRLRACDASCRSARLFQLLQLSVLLSNPFVQVLPLDICKFGRKQSAIPLNVSPMVPHLGSIEVSHPLSPLWMFLDVPPWRSQRTFKPIGRDLVCLRGSTPR